MEHMGMVRPLKATSTPCSLLRDQKFHHGDIVELAIEVLFAGKQHLKMVVFHFHDYHRVSVGN
jgi:hypothetical protein